LYITQGKKKTTVTVTKPPVMTKVFVHGLLNTHILQDEIWGERMQGKPYTLEDFELLSFEDNNTFIERKFGEQVAGKVYMLNEDQLKNTDWYFNLAFERKQVVQQQQSVSIYLRKINE